VKIPGEAMQWRANPLEWESKHLSFAVDVKALNGEASWTVYKRYSDFYQLRLYYEYLGGCDKSVAFPRKRFRRCEGAKLERRREKLEHWLQNMLHPIEGACVGPLQVFLECEDHCDGHPSGKLCTTTPDTPQSTCCGPSSILSKIEEESLRNSLMSTLNSSVGVNSIQEQLPEENHQ
jgi:hypothetical protein